MSLNRIVGCLGLALMFCASAQSQEGVIKGRVIDQQDAPVAGAHVTWLLNVKNVVEVHSGPVDFVVSNSGGHFVIRGLAVNDPYIVYAQKEDDDYPDMELGFFNRKDNSVSTTAVEGEKAADITIRVGPKAGRLNWNVTDAITGKSVNPTLEVKRIDTGGSFGSGGPANDTHLLPSDTDLALSVSAPGYRAWYYPAGDKKHSALLRLKPGEEKTLEIHLQPAK
jgi:hypothetical protein